ncbi:MAG TPA: hypothetical protein VK634_15010 [Reyranella sp.]|nr:hypothetical protein [Reyranella sp.]HTE81994.1 hypothetical protein [Reyranella sp.]
MSDTPVFEVTSDAVTLADMRLTTAAKVRAMIGGAPADDPTIIEPLIDRASAAIADYCGLARDLLGKPATFARETCRATWFMQSWRHHERCPRHTLRLPWRTPITAISSVVEAGVTLDPASYQLKPGGLLDRLSGDASIGWSRAKIVVVYVAGFTVPVSTNVPPALEQAVTEQVKSWTTARKRDPTIASESVPDVYQASYKVSGEADGNLLLSVEVGLQAGGYVNWAVES